MEEQEDRTQFERITHNPCSEIYLPVIREMNDTHFDDECITKLREAFREVLNYYERMINRNSIFGINNYLEVGSASQEQEKIEAARLHMENINNVNCKYFQDNLELRCAVNPMGACEGCPDFESQSKK